LLRRASGTDKLKRRVSYFYVDDAFVGFILQKFHGRFLDGFKVAFEDVEEKLDDRYLKRSNVRPYIRKF
jgi:hypothetical protein